MPSSLSKQRAEVIIRQIRDRQIVVLGDVMLDEFIWGDVSRISPEAPVPVVEIKRESTHPGGAANVMANLLALGAQACVIGVPDPQWDQNVKALIVLKSGASVSEAELIEHCRTDIASYKKPKLWAFVTALPRLASGALDRDAVDEAFGGGGYPSRGVPRS